MGILDELNDFGNDEIEARKLRDKIRETRSLPEFIDRSPFFLHCFWKLFNDSLWAISLENGIQYDSIRDWVDGEIAPTFNKRNDERDPAESMMQDIVRVVERPLPYAMKNPVKDKKGEVITPKRLIDEARFAKLKLKSSKFEDNLQTPERDELLRDLLALTVSELKKKYS